jgi:hypothetical protein
MTATINRTWLWHEVAQLLAAQPPGTVLRIQRHQVEHPGAAGLATSVAFPFGQRADFRSRDASQIGLYVRDFGPYYEAHLEGIQPSYAHDVRPPGASHGNHIAAMSALGALTGILLGRKPEAILAGAAVGGLLGVLTARQSVGDQRSATSP